MQKNWYIIYTKPKCEKKVATLLTKRKIENFFPLNYKEINSFRKRKSFQEPLFKSYIFTNIEENEIEKIKTIDGVVNIVYWKGMPAVIKEEEIKVIKDFITDYQDIVVEKTAVNVKDVARAINASRYSITGNVLISKNTMAKVNLPSIGYTLVAKVEPADSLHPEATFNEKKLLLQS